MTELKEEIRAKIKQEIIENESNYVHIWLYIFLHSPGAYRSGSFSPPPPF